MTSSFLFEINVDIITIVSYNVYDEEYSEPYYHEIKEIYNEKDYSKKIYDRESKTGI